MSDKSVLSDLASETLKEVDAEQGGRTVNSMLNVSMTVQVVLGEARMPVSQLLSLTRGSVVELDKRLGQPLDVIVGDRLVARGDLVKVGENGLGINLTEIAKDIVTGVQ